MCINLQMQRLMYSSIKLFLSGLCRPNTPYCMHRYKTLIVVLIKSLETAIQTSSFYLDHKNVMPKKENVKSRKGKIL